MLGKMLIVACIGATTLQTACGKEEKWIPLFDGKTLAGWSVQCTEQDKAKTYWSVKEGAIAVDSLGDKDHDYVWLMSDGEYSDFTLRLKFQIFKASPGNSGVQIRSRYDLEAAWMNGPQLDIHPPNPLRAGLVYDETRETRRWIHPSLERGNHNIKPEMTNPKVSLRYGEGEWNEMLVIAKGTHIVCKINGETATDYDGAGILDDADHARHRVGLGGHIALQLHTKNELKARFKEIEIFEL
jgi:hypothetical protein